MKNITILLEYFANCPAIFFYFATRIAFYWYIFLFKKVLDIYIYKQNILHIVRQKHIFSFICLNVYKSIWILNFLWELIYLLYVASILRIASLHDDEQSLHLVIGHWWIPTSSTTEYKQSSSNVYIIMFLLDYEGTKDNWIVQAD